MRPSRDSLPEHASCRGRCSHPSERERSNGRSVAAGGVNEEPRARSLVAQLCGRPPRLAFSESKLALHPDLVHANRASREVHVRPRERRPLLRPEAGGTGEADQCAVVARRLPRRLRLPPTNERDGCQARPPRVSYSGRAGRICRQVASLNALVQYLSQPNRLVFAAGQASTEAAPPRPRPGSTRVCGPTVTWFARPERRPRASRPRPAARRALQFVVV
jgi:hypothetical protein